MPDQTPLFRAENSARYERQALVQDDQELTGSDPVVVIDQVTTTDMTVLEEAPRRSRPRRGSASAPVLAGW
ncbi:hypothetical protein [Propionibacterium acidifaciens]|uniref:hypothetical protein n=1 Tax=Propionibacterium acidifaciens TaxID=556499 RepID=UPI0003F6DA88|nr:hypothetical protein [Propionibacterium acidifaciens]